MLIRKDSDEVRDLFNEKQKNITKEVQMKARFLSAEPDFEPLCNGGRFDPHVAKEMDPDESLTNPGTLAYSCGLCGRVKYFNSETGKEEKID